MAKANTKAVKKPAAATNGKSKKKKVTFQFNTDPGQEVLVAGTFNDWDIEDKKKVKTLKEKSPRTGSYTLNMFLPSGEYEYKFFSNGRWYSDPNADVRKLNSFGSFNSIIEIA